MASRNFNRYQALEKEVKTIYAEVSFAASGVPTLTSGLGVTSIVRNTTGTYTVTLDDKYVRLLMFQVMQVDDISDFTYHLDVRDEDAKTYRFTCLTGNTATDPEEDSSIFIKFDLKNSSSGE